MSTEDLQKLKLAPRQPEAFKPGDIVDSPVGTMMIVQAGGSELIDGTWIPKFWVGFITSKGQLNKTKRHRTFTQDRLTHNP